MGTIRLVSCFTPLLARLVPRWVRLEHVALVGLLIVVWCGFLVRLGSVVVSDMDEGAYIYAGKLLDQGALPYRDYLLAHPPLIAVFTGAVVWLAGPDIMAVRFASMLVVVASLVPLYVTTRHLTGSSVAGLLSIGVYIAGMLLLANMGRTVRLEPIMNAFMIAALAGIVLHPTRWSVRLLVGVLLALAILVKLVAVVPAVLLLLGELVTTRPTHQVLRRWAVTAAGAALILLPAAALLLSLPGFLDDVIRGQLDRPALSLDLRLFYLWQNVTRFPLIPIALLAAAGFIIRGRDPRVRLVSILAIGSTLVLVFAFKTYFGYYFVQVLPWVAIVFAAAAAPIARRTLGRWARPALLAGAVLLAGGVPVVYGEVYHRFAHGHTTSPAQIVQLLRGHEGFVYSMFPGFGLQAGRDLYPWYYTVDSLIPRATGRIGDQDFVRVFSACQALVLYPGELDSYPLARALVEHDFEIAYQDPYYTLWTRSEDAGVTSSKHLRPSTTLP
jgi:4-amino-4-deoxy-L-arabinose transferase-like glycosyltransferase